MSTKGVVHVEQGRWAVGLGSRATFCHKKLIFSISLSHPRLPLPSRENEGEFVELGEWIRLSTMYDMLRKLRFFKYFRLTKAFGHWNKVVRQVGGRMATLGQRWTELNSFCLQAHYKHVLQGIQVKLCPAIRTFQPVMQRVLAIVNSISEIKVAVVSEGGWTSLCVGIGTCYDVTF